MISEIQGFKLENTGGGCSALSLGEVLIVAAGTSEAPKELTDPVDVYFTDRGVSFYYDTLEQALKMF